MFLTPIEPSLSQRSLRKMRQRLVLLSLSGVAILLFSFGLIQKGLYDSAIEQGQAELARLASTISVTVAQADTKGLASIPLHQDDFTMAVLDGGLHAVHGSLDPHLADDLRATLQKTDHQNGTLICNHGGQTMLVAYNFMPNIDRVVVVYAARASVLGEWQRALALHGVLFLLILLVMTCLSVWLWLRLKRQHLRASDLAWHFNDVENALSEFGCAMIRWQVDRPQQPFSQKINWPEVLGSGFADIPATAKCFLDRLSLASRAHLHAPLIEDRWPEPQLATMIDLTAANGKPQRFYLCARRHLEAGDAMVTVLLLETVPSQEICNPFETYLRHSPEPALAIDGDGILRGVSAAFEQIIGPKAHGYIGQPFDTLFAPEDRGRARASFSSGGCSAMNNDELVFRLIDHDGNPRWLAWHCIGPQDGVILGSARDVSEFVENAQKLRETMEQLERSNEDLEQFAYVASHDLQQPLRMVTSYTQLLKRRLGGQLGPEADEYIDYAVDGAKRMHKLITHLLEYAKTGNSGENGLIDCNEVLNEAQADLKAAIQEEKATITHGALPTLYGNRIGLSRLFQNLIGNAIKYARPGVPPHIDIQVDRDPENPDFWRFTVHDNGIGIHPDHAQRIFRLFQRLHKDEFTGTGLGLSLCRKIVEQHGGTIWLDTDRPLSDPGATFVFTLRDIRTEE